MPHIDFDTLTVPELCEVAVATIKPPDRIVFYPLTREEGKAIHEHMTRTYPDVNFTVMYLLVQARRAFCTR